VTGNSEGEREKKGKRPEELTVKTKTNNYVDQRLHSK